MFIKSLYLRNFRSLKYINIEDLSNFNVFIGKNNAGKSTILAAIDLAFNHLKNARISNNWKIKNQAENEFTNKNIESPVQIGLTFSIDEKQDQQIRELVAAESIGFDAAISAMPTVLHFSAIINCTILGGRPTIYLEQIARGHIDGSSAKLNLLDRPFFRLNSVSAHELLDISNGNADLRGDVSVIEKIKSNPSLDYYFREQKGSTKTALSSLLRNYASSSPDSISRIEKILDEYEVSVEKIINKEMFFQFVNWFSKEMENQIEYRNASPLQNTVEAFSGSLHYVPHYVPEICRRLMDGDLLHLTEDRAAVGLEEASQLLSMKNQRGGMPRLIELQHTIKGLLGVHLDAFEASQIDDRQIFRPSRRDNRGSLTEPLRAAEIDVDDFLVEINGAGIREALRIVLDIELGEPSIVLIEEPEVHLHPGLEKILYEYLVDRSKKRQIFIATHSTSFIDISSRQSIFLVDRNKDKTSDILQVASEANILQVPENLGLRPSSVLMFDRLVFVEGPIDEAIFRAFAKTLQIDLASAGLNFIQIAGSAGFSSFSAEATINLLSRRQIKMWFVIDRDEKDDEDIRKMLERLGGRAQLQIFSRREIENYLLNRDAILSVLQEKLTKSRVKPENLSSENIDIAITEAVDSLKLRVLDLKLGKTILRPIYPQRLSGSIYEKLELAKNQIIKTMEDLKLEAEKCEAQIDTQWAIKSRELAPGSLILEEVFSKFSARYDKSVDGARIAEKFSAHEIDTEISRFIRQLIQ